MPAESLPSPVLPIFPKILSSPTHLSLGRLDELGMLLGVRLLDVTLCHLLHHEVAIDNNILGQLAISHTPLAGDGQDADGGLCVDEGIDAVGDVGEGEFVGCLWRFSIWKDGKRKGDGHTWPMGFLSVTR